MEDGFGVMLPNIDPATAFDDSMQVQCLPVGSNYPNQPERNPGSDLSDPLTYWWGVTLCPPELNDVSLAESVAILMRYAAIKEINLNTEVQKPSSADVLEFQCLRMDCTEEYWSRYTVPTNPWPRNAETEERDTVGLQKRKPIYKRQGPSNRWDQWSSSSSRWHSSAGDKRSWYQVSPMGWIKVVYAD